MWVPYDVCVRPTFYCRGHGIARCFQEAHFSVRALIPLCDVNARDAGGANALGAAIAHECDPEVLSALLSAGVDDHFCKGERSAVELVLQTCFSRKYSPRACSRGPPGPEID